VDDLQARLAAALAGRYTIEREIGRGGMSIVYQARDLRNDRWVALKVLRPELAGALGPARFLREIKVAAGLAHPHILPLFESDVADDLLFYTMPYVAGESLRHRLQRERRLPIADAVAIACDVADALAYAHAQNIVHRDIKPENILIEAGHAVVSDFGIARAISAANESRMTGVGIVVGTVDYMSPEQSSGEELDGRSDIYSLGRVLYEMLIGSVPAGARISTGTERRDIPLEIDLAIQTALAAVPGERFATASEFAAMLRESGSIAPSGWWWRRVRRRSRVGAALAATAAIALFVWRPWATDGKNGVSLDPTHIAVLYFDDLSPGGQLGPVANGITYDLIEALARVPTLRVISPDGVNRSAAMRSRRSPSEDRSMSGRSSPGAFRLRKIDCGWAFVWSIQPTVLCSPVKRLNVRKVSCLRCRILSQRRFPRRCARCSAARYTRAQAGRQPEVRERGSCCNVLRRCGTRSLWAAPGLQTNDLRSPTPSRRKQKKPILTGRSQSFCEVGLPSTSPACRGGETRRKALRGV